MKNLKTSMLAVAATAFLFAGCQNEGISYTQDEARFSAIIDGASRAYDQAWEANDEIGISCLTGDVTYTNVCYYTSAGDGNFSPKEESKKIYYQTDEEVTFTASYPWNDLQDGNALTADTWKQADQKNFDFLWAQANGSKANPEVSFAFTHRMAKLVLTVKCGHDVSYDEVKAAALSLEGFKHLGSFNVTTGVAAASGENSTAWTFAGSSTADNNAPSVADDETSTVVYTLICYPQAFEVPVTFTAQLQGEQSFTAGLDFTNANATKDGSAAKNEWVAGRQYNIGVKLNKTGISLDGCTIAAWDEVNGEVDANM